MQSFKTVSTIKLAKRMIAVFISQTANLFFCLFAKKRWMKLSLEKPLSLKCIRDE